MKAEEWTTKNKRVHTQETKDKISATNKAKGLHPPWELSPCYQGGYNRVELFGEEIAEKMRQATIRYNRNKTVSPESRLKMSEAKRGEEKL